MHPYLASSRLATSWLADFRPRFTLPNREHRTRTPPTPRYSTT